MGIYNLNTLIYERKLEGIAGFSLSDFVYIPDSNLIGVSVPSIYNVKLINFVCQTCSTENTITCNCNAAW